MNTEEIEKSIIKFNIRVLNLKGEPYDPMSLAIRHMKLEDCVAEILNCLKMEIKIEKLF
jgi:hypothetical protein